MEYQQLALELVKSALNGYELKDEIKQQLDDATLCEIYDFAKRFDMAHLVALALKRNGILPKNDTGVGLSRKIAQAVWRYENLNYELDRISEQLTDSNIKHIPLKGMVLCHYYPEPYMRTCGDIDILVDKSEIERAAEILSDKLKYKSSFIGPYDISLYTPNGIHVELHFSLEDGKHIKNSDNVVAKVWEYAKPVSPDAYKYEMKDEMFYFYHIAHMAKHVLCGGCGIRPFADIWVLNKRMEFDEERRRDLLVSGGLDGFEKYARALSDVWFANGEYDEALSLLADYVLTGGMYGTAENWAAMRAVLPDSIQKVKTKEKIWKPYDKLKYWYPSLEKHKYLILFYQIRRWIEIIFGGTVKNEYKLRKMKKRISDSSYRKTQYLLNKLELK